MMPVGEQLMSVPGIGPIISSAMVAAIGAGDAFAKGRDFAAWLGLVPRQMSTGDRTILGKISKRGNLFVILFGFLEFGFASRSNFSITCRSLVIGGDFA